MAAFPIAQSFVRGVVAWGARHSTARMRTRAAEIKVRDGGAVLRPAGNRTHEEKLIERKVAVENISFGKAVGALEIERGEDLAREDRIRNVGRVLGDLFHDAIA